MRNRNGAIYLRVGELSPSVTPETDARTWAMRLASEGVICFGTGQLLFVLPEHAVEAVGRAVTEPGLRPGVRPWVEGGHAVTHHTNDLSLPEVERVLRVEPKDSFFLTRR